MEVVVNSMGENGMVQVTVNANGEVFIIPNEGFVMRSKFPWQIEDLREINEFCRLNGVDEIMLDGGRDDKVVQVWITAERDLSSGNIGSLGFRVPVPGLGLCMDELQVKGSISMRNMPVKMIKDMKEGDNRTFTYKFEVDAKTEENEDVHVNLTLNLTLTADQTHFRYRGFGTFENAVAFVM